MTAPAFRHDGPGTSAAAWRDDPRWGELGTPVSLTGPRARGRLVVVAAHPDDESLGAGGAVAHAVAEGREVVLVVLTDGEGSHPGSPTHPPQRLAAVRRREAVRAAAALGVTEAPLLLGLPDGALAETLDGPEEGGPVDRLVEIVGDGRDTLLLAPWRHDGHPDHEAAGRATAACAVRTGAQLLEYPVWAWHWARPDDLPWASASALRLTAEVAAAKARAVAAHRSQVQALSESPGDEVLLGADLLAHFGGDREVYVAEPAVDGALDALHGREDDPWAAGSSWYEARKRALTCAVLPRERFRRGLEVGCSLGHLARDLAERCDELVAVDSSPRALAAAARVVPGDVRLERLDVPDGWPEGTFDLVVMSEVGYFLSPAALDATLERIRSCLADDGVVVLSHWRHRVAGWPLDGPDVHRRARRCGLPAMLARYGDADVEIVVHGSPEQGPQPGA